MTDIASTRSNGMSGERVKQGYLDKFAKSSSSGESWQKAFVELYKDGTIVWYKKKDDQNNKGSVSLKVVRDFLLVGSRCRVVPHCPQTPLGNSVEAMIAFTQEPYKKSRLHFFLASNEQDFKEWICAIQSTLPAKASDPSQGTAAPNAGIQNLSISGQPPPYNPGYAPGQMPHPQSGYPQPPYAYPPPPGAAYYPYPTQPQYAPQGYAQQPYAGQTTVVYEVRPEYQTVVVKEKKKDNGSAVAGVVAGAVAGVVAGEVISDAIEWGDGYGWDSGSWGSYYSDEELESWGSYGDDDDDDSDSYDGFY